MSVHDRVKRADKEQIQVRARIENLIHLFFLIPSTCVFWFLLRWSQLRQRITIFSIIFVVTELREMVERTDQQVEDELAIPWSTNVVTKNIFNQPATNDHVMLRVAYSRWFSRLLFSDICSYSRNGLSRNSGNSCIHTHRKRRERTMAVFRVHYRQCFDYDSQSRLLRFPSPSKAKKKSQPIKEGKSAPPPPPSRQESVLCVCLHKVRLDVLPPSQTVQTLASATAPNKMNNFLDCPMRKGKGSIWTHPYRQRIVIQEFISCVGRHSISTRLESRNEIFLEKGKRNALAKRWLVNERADFPTLSCTPFFERSADSSYWVSLATLFDTW